MSRNKTEGKYVGSWGGSHFRSNLVFVKKLPTASSAYSCAFVQAYKLKRSQAKGNPEGKI